MCVTDGSNNDQIALVIETAQFVMASLNNTWSIFYEATIRPVITEQTV